MSSCCQNYKSSKIYTPTIALVGDAGVGKTTFLIRHGTGEFNTKHLDTQYQRNLQFSSNHGKINSKVLEFLDVPLRNSTELIDAFIVMFDLTKPLDSVKISHFYDQIKNQFGNRVPIILCGNKCDEINSFSKVFHSGILSLKKDMPYYHVSAKSNYQFEKPFLNIFRQLICIVLQTEVIFQPISVQQKVKTTQPTHAYNLRSKFK